MLRCLNSKYFVLAFLILCEIIFSAHSVWAVDHITGCARELSNNLTSDLNNNHPETAFEVELRALTRNSDIWTSEGETILNLLTTTNGRVDGALDAQAISQLPPMPELVSSDSDFTKLLPKTRYELVKHVIRTQNVDFKSRRQIPGFRMRSILQLSWPTQRQFLGNTYEAGKYYDVDISELLNVNLVEIGDPDSFKIPALFEFHFRTSKYSPSQLQDEVFTLLEGLGLSKDKLHAHVVASMAQSKISREQDRFGLMNELRYLNLAAEIITVLEKNLSINASNPLDWDSMHDHNFYRLAECLQNYALGLSLCGKDEFKMAYVGFHFPTKYDGVENFGFQFRNLDKKRRKSFAPLMDQAQGFLLRPSFQSADEQLWLEKNRGQHGLGVLMSRLWYRSSLYGIELDKSSEKVKQLIGDSPRLRQLLIVESERHVESQMLIYNWANDPLFFLYSEQRAKIEKCQAIALSDVMVRDSYSLNITQNFLKCAGIFEAIMARLGIAN